MSARIPRFLLPRRHILPYLQLPKLVNPPQIAYRTLPTYRNASASTSKPRVLEKPTRFNPPSHGKRLKQDAVPRNYGPQLTAEQKTEQETKQYPHMMPPPGTWMYWFLTTTSIHTCIIFGVLIGLTAFVVFERWRLALEFREPLPSYEDIFTHPFKSIKQAWNVYAEDKARETGRNMVKRASAIDDVQKRNSYRIAHGTLAEDADGLGPWKPSDDLERARLEETYPRPVGVEPGQEFDAEAVVRNRGSIEGPINDQEGRKRPLKKWLGIW